MASNTSIIALILNLFFPGVGSLVASRTKEGIWQVVLWVLSIPLMFLGIGIVVYLVAWIWALVTSISLIRGS